MFENTKAFSFLHGRLSFEEMREFRRLLGEGGGELLMIGCSIEASVKSGKVASRKDARAYQIHPLYEDRRCPIYPPNERILELAGEHLPDAHLEIVEREFGVNRRIIVRLKVGTDTKQRQRFAQALAKETCFAS